MKQSALAIALLPLLFTPVINAETSTVVVMDNRAAQGDITTPGGARRLVCRSNGSSARIPER